MELLQFPYGSDGNLAYLLWDGVEAAAIDGGAVEDILDSIKERGLTLKYVLNTHDHYDHIPGNARLLKESDAVFYTPAEACSAEIKLGSEIIGTIKTPGHTKDSIVFTFYMNGRPCLLSGDTIFNGTVGNCYTKDYKLYFSSIEKLLKLASDTCIFAGHDIVDYTTGVVNELEPGNAFLSAYKNKCLERPLFTTLEQELKVNPFIRYNDPLLDELRKKLSKEKNMPIDTPYEKWRILMTIH
ncbi:MAG: MBL fold metallo-hydrolase [Spirochaetales bacterium]|nr:MBL fold metallo-hydrolase [Spirochaetales bacterium]